MTIMIAGKMNNAKGMIIFAGNLLAISRARCLSVVVANPRLLNTRCQTVEQITLVNTLCWVAAYGRLALSSESAD